MNLSSLPPRYAFELLERLRCSAAIRAAVRLLIFAANTCQRHLVWLLRMQLASALTLLLSIWLGSPLHAQTTPRIDSIFPPGAGRGSDVEIQLKGDFVPDDVQLDVQGPGVSLLQTVGKHRYRIRVAGDALPGPREFRWVATQGASAPFPFLVGDLPELVVDELVTQAGELQSTQPLPLRTLVNGRLPTAGAVARFSWECVAGQRLVCAVQTKMFRSPLDPRLRLVDDQGRVVAEGVAASSADRLLWFEASKPGKYSLQLYDFQLAGGDTYTYRLLATDGPWLERAFPVILSAGRESQVTISGWNLSKGGTETTIVVPAQPLGTYELALPGGVNRLQLPVVPEEVLLEAERNETIAEAQEIRAAVRIQGTLESRRDDGDQDWYLWTAKKGENLVFEVDAAKLSSPVDAVLSVHDRAGKKLVEQDDLEGSRDPRLRFTAPADGQYGVRVRDRSGSGGPEFVYVLRSELPQPDVKLRVQGTSFYIEGEKESSVTVLVQRLEGNTDELEVTAVDLPPGVKVQPEKVPEKTPATLSLKLKGDGLPNVSAGLARVVVKSKGSMSFERESQVAESPTALPTTRQVWIARGPTIPFALKTTTTILEAPRMAAFPFPVQVERKEGFTGPIRLLGVEPDRRGTVIPLVGEIPAGADVGGIPLVIQHRVTEGTTHRCRVMGVAEVPGGDGKMYQLFHVAPGAMSMGCEPSWLTLVATPRQTTWRPGERIEVDVRLAFRFPLGPVRLLVESPAGTTGVIADEVIVPPGASEAKCVVTIDPSVRLTPRAVFTLKGESTRGGLPVFGETTFRLDRE